MLAPQRKKKKLKRELAEFKEIVLPYVEHLLTSRQYSEDVCRQLMNPLSEQLNLELILDLVQLLCQKEVRCDLECN